MNANQPESRGAYVYEPLVSPKHIRLMILQPLQDVESDLVFCFKQESFEDVEGQYEALSYVWGEPIFEHRIYHRVTEDESGGLLLITTNLNGALRRLRNKYEPRMIWADALCINQQDDPEKATQIPLMANIFRGAERVVAWLGRVKEGSDVELSLKYLETLSRTHPKLRDDHGQINDIGNKPFVDAFVQQKYFTRLWIVQEIALNTDVVLFCGPHQITWTRLLRALKVLQEQRSQPASQLEQDESTEPVLTMARLWRTQSWGWGKEKDCASQSLPPTRAEMGSTQFIGLIENLQNFECGDPRDRIFAIYNLSQSIQPVLNVKPGQEERASEARFRSLRMNVDYTKTILETYTAFTIASLKISWGEGPSVFPFLLRRQYYRQDSDWPSWVVDWRRKPADYAVAEMDSVNRLEVTLDGRIGNKLVKLCLQLARPVPYEYYSRVRDSIIDEKLAYEGEGDLLYFLKTLAQRLQRLTSTRERVIIDAVVRLLRRHPSFDALGARNIWVEYLQSQMSTEHAMFSPSTCRFSDSHHADAIANLACLLSRLCFFHLRQPDILSWVLGILRCAKAIASF